MLAVSRYIKDVSVLRRMLFASTYLPDDLPNYWQVIVEFGTLRKNTESIKIDEAKVLFQNIKELDSFAFANDQELFSELISLEVDKLKGPLGVVLISSNDTCSNCKSKLLLRKDRPARVIVYHDSYGSLPGSHYHKYCNKRSCGFTQYYGYYTMKGSTSVYYDSDWKSFPYFVSSRETVFSMKLLEHFDAQVLIGQLSFKQCADLYNYLNAGESKQMSP